MRDDDGLFVAAIDYEDWLIEERRRYEQQLRRDRLRQGGAAQNLSLASFVGVIPSKYNQIYGQQGQPSYSPSTNFSATLQGPNCFNTPVFNLNHINMISQQAFAPDGTITAWKLMEDATSNLHYLGALDPNFGGGLSQVNFGPLCSGSNVFFRVAAIVKPVERTRICLGLVAQFAGPTAIACFDLAGVTTGFSNVAGANWTIIATSIQKINSVNSGWLLCTMDAVQSGTAQLMSPSIYLDNGSGSSPQQINYVGNGSSGVHLWWMSMLPTGAWKIQRQPFFDDFLTLSTIDLTNTRGSGFNWYVNNFFAHCTMTTFFQRPPSFPTPQTALSVSNSILTINNVLNVGGTGQPPSGFTSQLWTVCDTSDITGVSSSYNGQVWGPPMIAVASMAWDNDLAATNSARGVPAFWGLSLEGLIGVSGDMFEIDGMEGGNPAGAPMTWDASTTAHAYHGPSSTLHSDPLGGYPIGFQGGAGCTLSDIYLRNLILNFNEYGYMWIDKTQNQSNTGAIFSIFNGCVNNVGISYSPTINSGVYSPLDNQHMPVFMDTSDGTISGANAVTPFHIDYVSVYTQ